EQHSAAHEFWKRRDHPVADRGAPVLPDEKAGTSVVARIDQSLYIHHEGAAVVVAGGGNRCRRITAQPRRNDPIPGRGKRGDLRLPRLGVVGEAVEQDDERSIDGTRLQEREPDAVRLGVADVQETSVLYMTSAST